MKRILIGLAVLIAIGVAVAALFREQIVMRAMEGVVADRMAADVIGDLPDGLHVALCGAGSPLPDEKRSGPCTAVIAGKTLLVFDAGTGGARQLALMNMPVGQIEALFLTHFHSDHIDGLGEMMLQRWVNGSNTAPLPIYGPPGTRQVVAGFNLAYAHDFTYRVAHHGEETVPPGGAGGEAHVFVDALPGALKTVFTKGENLTVQAFQVNHHPVHPAIGYKVIYKDRSLIISGDTKKSPLVAKAAKGVDLLVHEALSPELVGVMTKAAQEAGRANIAKITHDILDYHTSPVEAAQIAAEAQVGMLLYTHIVPPLPLAPMKSVFLRGVSDVYSGPVEIGEDGTLVSLPAGTTDIETGNLK